MKPVKIREMTREELARSLDESRREVLNLRLHAQTGQLENTDRVRQVRRDIARLLTEQNARNRQQSKQG
jgi:large subunit ribosomal protein L29